MIDLNDIPPEGVMLRLYTGGPPDDGALPSDAYARSAMSHSHDWSTVTFKTAWTGGFDGAVLYSAPPHGRQLGARTPVSGWVFFVRPLPRPWKIHQSRFRQRRRR